MIDYRLSQILSHAGETVSFSEIEKITDIQQEKVLQVLTSINQNYLNLYNEHLVIEKETFLIPTDLSRKWVTLLFATKRKELVFSEAERQAMIYLLCFASYDELSVFYFQEFLLVSKNTILNDLKKLRLFLKKQQLVLSYSRKTGFSIVGEEICIRSTAFYLLRTLSHRTNGKRLLYEGIFNQSTDRYAQVRSRLFEIGRKFDLVFVPSRFEEMVYFIGYLTCRMEHNTIVVSKEDQQLLRPLTMYQASQNFLHNFAAIKNESMESYYLTIAFMTMVQGEIQDTSLDFLMDCSWEIIHEIERLAAIEFKNYRKLLLDLFYHLVPAYFRIRFHFTLNNLLINEIKVQYNEIFELTKLALYPLKNILNQQIPEEEIGYFTILFGGEISNQREKKTMTQLKALILCPSGISSSLIMKSQLQELFPQIDFIETSSFETFTNQSFESDFDLIFSSVAIQTTKKVYVIRPIMTQLEKNTLLRNVQKDFLVSNSLIPSVNEILDILVPHIELKGGVTREKLYKLVQRKVNKEMKRKEDGRPMLKDLLTNEMIVLSDRQLNWEEAIALAAEPLKASGKIDARYIDAMINKVKDNGPFIHIGQGVALPHARPEEGVNAVGMSLLKVAKPVWLADDKNHQIQLFICLAAIDNETHLKALASLTKILSTKETMNQLLDATTKEELLKIINEGEVES